MQQRFFFTGRFDIITISNIVHDFEVCIDVCQFFVCPSAKKQIGKYVMWLMNCDKHNSKIITRRQALTLRRFQNLVMWLFSLNICACTDVKRRWTTLCTVATRDNYLLPDSSPAQCNSSANCNGIYSTLIGTKNRVYRIVYSAFGICLTDKTDELPPLKGMQNSHQKAISIRRSIQLNFSNWWIPKPFFYFNNLPKSPITIN